MAGITASYSSATQFTVSGDYTAELTEKRRIKANCGVDGYKYSEVTSSSHAGGTTTVNIDDAVLTSNLSEFWFGVVGVGNTGALPPHTHDSDDQGGHIDIASETIVKDDITPQLGGDLDVNDFAITFASSGSFGIRFTDFNDTTLVQITSGGNIGIGTTSPLGKLHVQSGEESSLKTYTGLGEKQGLVIEGYRLDSGDYARFVDFAALGDTEYDRASNIRFLTKSATGDVAEAVRITGDGNVGIGTNSPGKILELKTGTQYDGPRLLNGSGQSVCIIYGGRSDNDGGALRLYDNNTSKVKISSFEDSFFNGGDVGIGTDSPLAPLHINKTSSGVGLLVYDENLTDGDLQTIRIGKSSSDNEALGIEYKHDTTTSLVSMHFYGDSFGDSLVFEYGGNVAVGTDTPLGKFHVEGDIIVESKFQIEYNSTSESLDFNFIG